MKLSRKRIEARYREATRNDTDRRGTRTVGVNTESYYWGYAEALAWVLGGYDEG